MIQNELKISIKDLVPGYRDDESTGCYAFDGRLCIRPDYQRAFVYSNKQRDLVIDTVRNGMPLGVMYWMEKADGSYECMDGQQRTLSILQYIAGAFSMDYRYFHNLSDTEKQQILDYDLFLVYVCKGTDEERREWFRRINIAGATLTDQEILNSVYSGPWCQDAKKYFSKPGGPAAKIADKYLKGSAIRQDYLETALGWICYRDNIEIQEYMARHQHDATALALWTYFRSVIDWADALFGNDYRKKLMQGLPWGEYYNKYSGTAFDPGVLARSVEDLLADEDVTAQRGVYEYLLSGKTEEKVLHIRAFSDKDKQRKLIEQGCKCAKCQADISMENSQGDHIIPWSRGGHTVYDNLQMLCKKCNGMKSDK